MLDGDFVQDSSEVGTLDAYAIDEFRVSILAEQIDLRLPGAGDVDMRGLMILCVDHEAKAECAMNNNHGE
ncbi:hypothetical protein J2045_004395 [Peteryoungia aggregata LMG 23059]|uniref:Uncharacterized protein n=1 Tax=Peteryoungia aggregata LMG 23059 TaxID=1368425 RepID=A0ABU0GDG5_9HYPH|nr:hypothetical protein [Peteryoungia aggregata LMG 23059]